jgi:hypothetical protein
MTDKNHKVNGECSLPTYQEIKNNNPVQHIIDSFLDEKHINISFLNSFASGNLSSPTDVIDEKDYDKALRYLVPRELKPGDALNTHGFTKIRYQDFAIAAQDIENISPNDAYFNKMPRIFIYPEPPPENTKIGLVARKMQSKSSVNQLAYHFHFDAIAINEEIINKHTRNEIVGMYAHEYGHRMDYANLGSPSRDKLENIITKPLRKENLTEDDLSFLRKMEITADAYASYVDKKIPGSNYNGYLINVLASIPDMTNPKFSTHPSHKERIKAIEEIRENQPAALKKLEAELANIGCQNFSAFPASHNDIKSNLTPVPNAAPKADKSRETSWH